MSSAEAPVQAFLEILQAALQDLYNPAALRRNPLLGWLAGDRHDPLAATRRLLIDAIKALKPGEGVPDHANAWRVYHILSYRYIEQLTQKEVASELAISVRQLRRLEHDAIQVLADHLWEQFALADRATDLGSAPAAQTESSETPASVPGRNDELAWLRSSLPDEVTEIEALLASVLETITPLAEAQGVQITYEIATALPPVRGARAAIRQALLNLLAAAVNAASARQVFIILEAGRHQVAAHVRATGQPAAGGGRPGQEIHDKLQMTQELCVLFGGELEVSSQPEPALAFDVTVHMPTVQPLSVLVIDDNVDALRLLKRYLDGTRYAFVGISDPTEALEVAEKSPPDIIVLDVMLPGMDGWEVLGRLRAHPKLQSTSLVVCTILPQEQLALALGAAGFLRKPVTRDGLLDLLGRLSEEHS